MYGTSDWYVIQYITTTGILDVSFTNTILHRILVSVFLFSIFFKLGVTPFHLFKIEVYKGIPLLSIFFYTTYYFVVFFIFFLYFLSDFIATYVIYYYLILVLLLFVGSCYTIVLLFDVSFLKAFFTYSTIINTIGFLTAFVAAL
jgi:NADH:ubiquinone oxidoreductase subunit 2 (subunit N)